MGRFGKGLARSADLIGGPLKPFSPSRPHPSAAVTDLPYSLVALAGRVAVAGVFWKSGRTKVEDGTLFTPNETVFFLFEHEYNLPLISPALAAPLATYAEFFLPILLVLGLLTRFAALSMLAMTVVIQTFVYPLAWDTHLTWATILMMLIAFGPGRLSLDHGAEKLLRR